MLCKVIFYENKSDNNIILRNLRDNSKSVRIVTDDTILHEFLEKNGFNSSILGDLFPNEGPIADEIYNISKNLHESYERIFDGLKFNGIQLFSGFRYPFLRQLTILTKIRKILEEKQDVIFTFKGFSEIFFIVPKLAKDLGYDENLTISFVQEGKLKVVTAENRVKILEYGRRFSRRRILQFLKYSLDKEQFFKSIKTLTFFAVKATSFFVKSSFYNSVSKINFDPTTGILKKIENKISNENTQIQSACFVTTSREDIYLRPWNPVLMKFKKEKIPYQVFTADLPTSITLSKEKISFIEMFEEMSILKNQIKKCPEGKKIREKLESIVSNNSPLIGFNEWINYFLNQIYRSMGLILILEQIIKNNPLKSIEVIADGEMLESLAVEISKKYNIPSYSLLPTVISHQPIFRDWFTAEKIFVDGYEGFESLTNLGYSSNRIIISGNPRYDHLKKIDSKKVKEFLEQSYNIDSKKNLIVVGMSIWHENDELWLSNLIEFCNKNKIEIVIKIHPAYKQKQFEFSEKKIEKIKTRCSNLKFLITYDVDLTNLIPAADLVITEHSNAGVIAILLDKPLLTVNFLKESFNYYIQYHKFGASKYLESYEDLEKYIIEILEDKKHLSELRKGRNEIIDRFNLYNDGNASTRIFNMLIKNSAS